MKQPAKIVSIRLDISDYDRAENRLSLIGVTPEQAIKQFVKDLANGGMIAYLDALNTKMWQKQEDRQGYTLADVCEVLHISQRTAYRYIEQGKINAVKEGKFYTVTDAELERILNEGISRTSKATTEPTE